MSHAELNVYTAETAPWKISGLVAVVFCGNTDVNIVPPRDWALVRGHSNNVVSSIPAVRDLPNGQSELAIDFNEGF